MSVPTLADVTAAWHDLPAEMRDRIGVIAIDMVFQAFVSGDACIASDQPEDLAVLDETVRGLASAAEDRRLNELHQFVEGLLPDLFGPSGENPAWSENAGPTPTADAIAYAKDIRADQARRDTAKRERQVSLQEAVATAIAERWELHAGPETEDRCVLRILGLMRRRDYCAEFANAALIELGEIDADADQTERAA